MQDQPTLSIRHFWRLRLIFAGTLLVMLVALLVAIRISAPWQPPNSQYQIPVTIQTYQAASLSHDLAEVVIPRNVLPDALKTKPIQVTALSPDGKTVLSILGPQQSSSPIVVWLKPLDRPLPNQAYLYLRLADRAVMPADLPWGFDYFDPFYDPFTDPDISDWETLSSNEGIVPPLSGHTSSRKHRLHDRGRVTQ